WDQSGTMSFVNLAVAEFNRLGASQGISLRAVLEGSASSANSIRFHIDPNDPLVAGGEFWGATSNNIDSAGFITGGGRIVFYHMQAVRSVSAHELGHAFGFWHSNNPSDVMYLGSPMISFTDIEVYVAGAMLRREPKTSWVDADPGTVGAASLSGAAHTETIVCR
ncbi:MAG: M57 family metalloprotease, partial [Patescibacteria group bacterium]